MRSQSTSRPARTAPQASRSMSSSKVLSSVRSPAPPSKRNPHSTCRSPSANRTSTLIKRRRCFAFQSCGRLAPRHARLVHREQAIGSKSQQLSSHHDLKHSMCSSTARGTLFDAAFATQTLAVVPRTRPMPSVKTTTQQGIVLPCCSSRPTM